MTAPFPQGVKPYEEALQILDKHVTYVWTGDTWALALRSDDGDLTTQTLADLNLIFAALLYLDNNNKQQPALKEWLRTDRPGKRWLKPVFKKAGTEGPDEHNLLKPFAIEEKRSKHALQPIWQHLRDQVSDGDRQKFKYLIRYLAHAVQRPEENPEVAPVLTSAYEGPGKSILKLLLQGMVGETHVDQVADPMELYKNRDFNDHTRRWLFAFADDMNEIRGKDAARLRGAITNNVRRIEPKGKPKYNIPNVIRLIPTSNSDVPIEMGRGSRRYVIYRMREEKIGDLDYFNRLVSSITNGGAAQLLYLLNRVNLKGWHPRQLPPNSAEIRTAQEARMPPQLEWLDEAKDSDELPKTDEFGRVLVPDGLPLGRAYAHSQLYITYAGWAKLRGKDPGSTKRLSMLLKSLLGENCYLEKVPTANRDASGKPARGWYIPSAAELRLLFDAYYDPRQRKGLTQRIELLRAAETQDAAAEAAAIRVKAARNLLPAHGDHMVRVANPLETAIIAAWPEDWVDQKPVALDDLRSQVISNYSNPSYRQLAGSISALIVAATHRYPGESDDRVFDVISATSGAVFNGLQMTVTKGGLTVHKLPKRVGAPVTVPPLPAGILPLTNGGGLDVITGASLTAARLAELIRDDVDEDDDEDVRSSTTTDTEHINAK